jgi:hypothetical protein
MISNWARAAVLMFLAGCLRPPALDAADAEFAKARNEAELILKQIEKSRTERILVEFEIFVEDGAPFHRIMAMTASGNLYTLSAHFPTGSYTWQSDPFAQEYFVHQGITCHQWPFNRTFQMDRLEPARPIPGSFAYDTILRVLPIWILADYKVPPIIGGSETPVTVLEALRSGGYSLSPQNEFVGEEECVVFERNNTDRIYLAAQKGFCLMRRDICDSSSTRIRQRILTERIKCVAPGLWLPADYTQQYFLSDPNAPDGILQKDTKVHVVQYLINDQVDEKRFIPAHPPGSMEFYSNKDPIQVMPGGMDLLDQIVDLAKALRLPVQSPDRWHKYAWLLGGLLTGALAAELVAPRKKNAIQKVAVSDHPTRQEHGLPQ